jgi:hypothetical protein
MDPNYYTVISPQSEEVTDVQKYIDSIKGVAFVITKESGKQGTHDHWNIIWYRKYKDTDKVTRAVKNDLKKHGVTNHPNLVKTKRITNFQHLLDYVTKESDFVWEVVPDDIKEKQDKRNKIKRKTVKIKPWKQTIQFKDFPHFAVWYLQEKPECDNGNDMEIFYSMIKDGFNVVHLQPRMKQLMFAVRCLQCDTFHEVLEKYVGSEFYDKNFNLKYEKQKI